MGRSLPGLGIKYNLILGVIPPKGLRPPSLRTWHSWMDWRYTAFFSHGSDHSSSSPQSNIYTHNYIWYTHFSYLLTVLTTVSLSPHTHYYLMHFPIHILPLQIVWTRSKCKFAKYCYLGRKMVGITRWFVECGTLNAAGTARVQKGMYSIWFSSQCNILMDAKPSNISSMIVHKWAGFVSIPTLSVISSIVCSLVDCSIVDCPAPLP